ncbi:hypothetical protein NM688_g9082 [Phlebia brevispora]|uniref:Uncharacterized protein n=1 Tax=Phlebia brevispora TaxID=194682 RepID=A0ACC1RL03_9APHY|nr:hypothetical protein NM688_g9082 [Phlebia brevispora]
MAGNTRGTGRALRPRTSTHTSTPKETRRKSAPSRAKSVPASSSKAPVSERLDCVLLTPRNKRRQSLGEGEGEGASSSRASSTSQPTPSRLSAARGTKLGQFLDAKNEKNASRKRKRASSPLPPESIADTTDDQLIPTLKIDHPRFVDTGLPTPASSQISATHSGNPGLALGNGDIMVARKTGVYSAGILRTISMEHSSGSDNDKEMDTPRETTSANPETRVPPRAPPKKLWGKNSEEKKT